MNILGIGTDLVDISRIEKIWNSYDLKFANHILAPSELITLTANKQPVRFLAKRFAAKEAIVKALGTGFRGQLYFSNIIVNNNELGKPEVVLPVNIVGNMHLSISDEINYALAFAIWSK